MLFQRLRRYAVIFFSLAALSPALIQPAGSTPAPTSSPSVVELRIDGEIEPVLAEYIVRGINEANADHASLILITMNTPGGLDTSMREIIQAILASKVPVCAYVAPTGSRAASAGFFILLSADIAAMSPGTDTGAASPILVFGGQPVQIDETLHKKIVNEATAYLRSYVTQRGRNAILAATAVTDAKAFSEKEALDGKLVDLIAAQPRRPARKTRTAAPSRASTARRFSSRSRAACCHRARNDRTRKIPHENRPARRVLHSADRRCSRPLR